MSWNQVFGVRIAVKRSSEVSHRLLSTWVLVDAVIKDWFQLVTELEQECLLATAMKKEKHASFGYEKCTVVEHVEVSH